MRNKTLYIYFICLLFFGCNQRKSKDQQPLTVDTLSLLTPKLIQACIDSTLVLDSQINTLTFLVDLELLRKSNPNLFGSYLKDYPNIKLTNLDSLKKGKSDWLKKEFFQNDIIRLEKIEIKNDSSILIQTTKNRAIDASFGTEMIFTKQDGKLICLKSNITWIN